MVAPAPRVEWGPHTLTLTPREHSNCFVTLAILLAFNMAMEASRPAKQMSHWRNVVRSTAHTTLTTAKGKGLGIPSLEELLPKKLVSSLFSVGG